jgi:hypothetical protein
VERRAPAPDFTQRHNPESPNDRVAESELRATLVPLSCAPKSTARDSDVTPPRNSDPTPETAGPETLASRTARVIEDPFASALAGLAIPAAAVGFLISAMYGLAQIY